MLIFPHHTSSIISGYSTILLSFGLLPVFSYEETIKAPEDEIVASASYVKASLYKSEGEALRMIVRE